MLCGFLTDGSQDDCLVDRIKHNDTSAFETLMIRCGKRLYNYILFRTKNESDATDILQETMLSVWRSIASYEGNSSFKTWAFSIARKRIADYYRSKTRGILPLADFEDELPSDGGFEAAIESADVDRAVSRLNEKERELIYLVFQAQLSYQEISDMLGIPAGTVKSRISGIKAKLKTILGAEG